MHINDPTPTWSAIDLGKDPDNECTALAGVRADSVEEGAVALINGHTLPERTFEAEETT